MGPNVDVLKNQTDAWGTVMGATIACYKGVDLEHEFQDPHRDGGGIADYAASTRDFIQKERDCDFAFTLLSPSLGADQHLRAEQTERLEELRRANELKIAELDRRSQESSQAIAEATRRAAEATAAANQALLNVTTQAQLSNTKYTVAFLILALISCLQVLSLVWPNGIAPLVDHAPWQPRPAVVATATAQPSTPSTSAGRP